MSDCCSNGNGSYDLAVVGAGSAGFSAAITAAEDGARVALIGHGVVGGTCVNVGCVPSKAIIRAMEVMHAPCAARRFDGIEAEAWITDWAAVVRQKQALVDDLRAAKYIDVLPKHNGIAYVEGAAQFAEDGKLTVDGDPLQAAKIILATGSRPHVPDIPGMDQVRHHDSTSILELETLPSSMIVMGGGYIGVELAQVFARAGVRVTILTRRGLLPDAEPEIGEALTRAFENEGIAVRTVTSYSRVAQTDGGIALTVVIDGNEEIVKAEELLLATGRMPNTESLALARADSIQTAALVLKTGMTYEELGAMIFPYLTTVEGLKLAAQTFDKDVAALSCCAG